MYVCVYIYIYTRYVIIHVYLYIYICIYIYIYTHVQRNTHVDLAVCFHTERSKVFLQPIASLPSLGSSVVGLTHIAHGTHDGPSRV